MGNWELMVVHFYELFRRSDILSIHLSTWHLLSTYFTQAIIVMSSGYIDIKEHNPHSRGTQSVGERQICYTYTDKTKHGAMYPGYEKVLWSEWPGPTQEGDGSSKSQKNEEASLRSKRGETHSGRWNSREAHSGLKETREWQEGDIL